MSGEQIGKLKVWKRQNEQNFENNQSKLWRIAKTDLLSYRAECRNCFQCLVVSQQKERPLVGLG
jgi:hypothetical protein